MSNQAQRDLGGRHATTTVPPPPLAAAPDGLRELLYLSPGGAGRMHALTALKALGWNLRRATDARNALRLLQAGPHIPHAVLVDLREGFTARDLNELGPALTAANAGWIAGIHAEQLSDALVRRLIRDYCYDYVTLPCPEAVLHTVIGHGHGMAALSCGQYRGAEHHHVDGMIGDCDGVRTLCRMLGKAATSDAPVFIAGETGTGKELAAVALHRHSPRSRATFVAINCGAIPHNQVESELFGYERGAFTGAQQRKLGRIELANGGTLFLDEIGDLPLDSQTSLLRFLEQGTIERVGGQGPIPVDVRIVCATHHDLDQDQRSPDRGDASAARDADGGRPVPRRSLLPAGGVHDLRAAAARAQAGHHAAGRSLRREVRARARQAHPPRVDAGDRHADVVPLAGERAGTREHHRAIGARL